MMKKLLLFTVSILFFTSLSMAQSIKVWDFGAVQLDGATYDNQLDVASMNTVIDANDGTVEPGAANSSNTIATPGLDFGAVKYFTNSDNDRLRTSNTGLTRRDDNVGGNFEELGLAGRIYVNSGGKRERYLSITTTENNQAVTIIMRGENFDAAGGQGHRIVDAAENEVAFAEITDSNIKEFHVILPTAGEYQYFDTVGKPSWYRVYFGNVTIDGIPPEDVIGDRLSANNFASKVSTNVRTIGNRVYISEVKSNTEINLYSITGALVKSLKTGVDTDFSVKSGLYIATLKTAEGQKSVKLLAR